MLFKKQLLHPIVLIPSDPRSLLNEADHLSWLDNWPEAGSLYARPEELFRELGDQRNETYARIGRIRAVETQSSWKRASRLLQKELRNPVVKSNLKLRLWCLALAGYVDMDINTASAKRSWAEAFSVATLGEQQWAARAKGELSIIAFLDGNPTRAVSLIGQALFPRGQRGQG